MNQEDLIKLKAIIMLSANEAKPYKVHHFLNARFNEVVSSNQWALQQGSGQICNGHVGLARNRIR